MFHRFLITLKEICSMLVKTEVSQMVRRGLEMNSLRGAKQAGFVFVTPLFMFPSIFTVQERGKIQYQCLESDSR